jgi:aminoglycoside phosphotransferase family enzyme/predicted kinase
MAGDLRGSPVIVPADAEEHETHLSRVRLHGDRAYKLRKPVRFAFVDQTTVATRTALAAQEVDLNQALAPETYLGLRPVEVGADGAWTLGAAGDTGDDREVVVEMRRFAEDDTLAARVRDGRLKPASLQELGARLADFHAEATALAGGGARSTLARLNRNLEELIELVGPGEPTADLWRIFRPLMTYTLHNAALLDERASAGLYREGHGDLRADHVVLDERGVRIVDRLEFDRALRTDDVAADLAFLLMDLEAHDGREAADEILTGYRAAGGDPGDERLLALWGAYRATVTAKVALLLAAQTCDPASLQTARDRLVLARRLAWRTRLPLILVICGPPASGKSTLAAALHQRTGLPVVSSDIVRKGMARVELTDPAPAEAYTAAATMAVYDVLGQRASGTRAFHGGAIVDATMSTADDRAVFAAGLRRGTRTIFVQCHVPVAVAFSRARAREAHPDAISDASAEVASRLRAAWEPLDEIDPADHITIRADRPLELVLDDIECHLDEVTP